MLVEPPWQYANVPDTETEGIALIVKTVDAEAAKQEPAPSGSSVVNVNVTEPAAASAAEGVYVVPTP